MVAIRTHLTYANVMATIAVFGGLGGTAWAISANSVGSKQIKPNAVKNSEIANNAVKSPEVANGSLLGEDFAAGQLSLAFGFIAVDGTLQAPDSKNVGLLGEPVTAGGVYCLDVTTAQAPRNVTATVASSGATPPRLIQASVAPAVVASECPAFPAADAVVETFRLDTVNIGGTIPTSTVAFYVSFN